MDRLSRFGVVQNATCVLCSSNIETHRHLFFDCPFSNMVWQSVSLKVPIRWPRLDWFLFLRWAMVRLKKKDDPVFLVARITFAACVYFIWYERNRRIFDKSSVSEDKVAREIWDSVRSRLGFLNSLKALPDHIKDIWGLN